MVDASLCAPLLAELRSKTKAELRDAVLAAVAEAVPGVRSAPLEDVAIGVALIVGSFVKALEDEPLSSTDRVHLRDAGQRWAANGLDASTATAVVATASQSAFSFLSEVADRARFQRNRDRRPAVEHVGRALMRRASDVQQALLAGVGNGVTRRGTAVETFVDRVLCDAPDRWEGVEDEASAAGFEDGAGLVIVLPGPKVTEGDLLALADRLAEHRGQRGSVQPDPIPHVAVLVKRNVTEAWDVTVRHFELDVAAAGCELVAARNPVPLTRLPLAYLQCRENLSYQGVLPFPTRLVDPAELQMCGAFAKVPIAARHYLFELIVGPLLQEPDLLHLLDGLVAIGPYEEVERVLGRPERTISRAVVSIKRATGYDWNTPRGCFMLTVATHLRWLAAQSLGEFAVPDWGPVPRFSVLGGTR